MWQRKAVVALKHLKRVLSSQRSTYKAQVCAGRHSVSWFIIALCVSGLICSDEVEVLSAVTHTGEKESTI